MAREPGVGLDRDRVRRAARVVPLRIGVGEAVAVALGREVALELGDEQPAVREDQDAELARRLDEAGRGDRLARTRSDGGSGSGGPRPGRRRGSSGSSSLLVDEAGVEVVVGLLVELGLGDGAVPAAVRRCRCRSRPPRAASRRSARRACRRARRPGGGGARSRRRFDGVLGQHALEPEHEPVAHLPAGRRLARARLHLLERVVERGAAGGAGRERDRGLLAGVRGTARRTRPRRGAAAAVRSSGVSDVSVGVVVASCMRAARTCRAAPSEELTLACNPASGTARAYLRRVRPQLCEDGRASSGVTRAPSSASGRPTTRSRDAGLVEVLRDPAEPEREARAEDAGTCRRRRPRRRRPPRGCAATSSASASSTASWISSTRARRVLDDDRLAALGQALERRREREAVGPGVVQRVAHVVRDLRPDELEQDRRRHRQAEPEDRLVGLLDRVAVVERLGHDGALAAEQAVDDERRRVADEHAALAQLLR